jgi:Flp pilus assembly pilin Flp
MRSIAYRLIRLLRRSDRGAVLVEYTAVFGFVSIGLALAIVKLGPTLLTAWDSTRAVILSNKP